MNGKNLLAIGLVAGIVIWLKSRKQLFDNALFFISGVKIDGSILNPQLTIQIGVKNPTPQEQTINSVEGNILLNDSVILGTVLQTTPQIIAANTTSILNLPVNVQLANVINTISQLLQNNHGKYSFVGTINVYGLNVAVNQSYTL